MTYSIEAIMSAVTDMIKTQTGVDAATHILSRKGIHLEGAPPRIVWAEGDTDDYGPPRTLYASSGQSRNPRALWSVTTPVDIHIWAQSKTQMESLRNNEVAAIHRVLHGSYAITRGMRVQADDANLSLGYSYILSIQIMQPITDVILPTVKITSADNIQHNVIMDLPTDEECGHYTAGNAPDTL